MELPKASIIQRLATWPPPFTVLLIKRKILLSIVAALFTVNSRPDMSKVRLPAVSSSRSNSTSISMVTVYGVGSLTPRAAQAEAELGTVPDGDHWKSWLQLPGSPWFQKWVCAGARLVKTAVAVSRARVRRIMASGDELGLGAVLHSNISGEGNSGWRAAKKHIFYSNESVSDSWFVFIPLQIKHLGRRLQHG